MPKASYSNYHPLPTIFFDSEEDMRSFIDFHSLGSWAGPDPSYTYERLPDKSFVAIKFHRGSEELIKELLFQWEGKG